jgi:UDP-N-acetyl-D-mannosaminuronate dehydrogenase
MKTCVIGLGEVGSPTIKHIKNQGIDVVGHDIDWKAALNAIEIGIPSFDKFDDIPRDCEVFIICASTSSENGAINVSAIESICESIADEFCPELVSIESTVWIGTTRRMWCEVFNKSINMVHVPQRFWAKDPRKRGVARPRVIGAVDEKSLYKGLAYYKSIGIEPKIGTTVETVEFSKVLENAWTHVWIGFAEASAMMCDRAGIDYAEVRELIATASDVPDKKRWAWQPQYNLARAEEGIGGHCLPMAAEWIARQFDVMADIVHSSISTDAAYRKWLENNESRERG